jgi:hypothetical protein
MESVRERMRKVDPKLTVDEYLQRYLAVDHNKAMEEGIGMEKGHYPYGEHECIICFFIRGPKNWKCKYEGLLKTRSEWNTLFFEYIFAHNEQNYQRCQEDVEKMQF